MKLNHAYPALLALLLTLALAGCRREPLPESGDAIRFSVSYAGISSAPTKAVTYPTVVAPGNLLEKNGVTVPVWGSLTVNGNKSNVFKDESLPLVCTVTGTTDEDRTVSWNYTKGRYYWNRTASYQFRSAFAPGHDSDVKGSADEVKVDFSGGYDLMVAATAVPAGNSQEAKLVFRHASSAVRFYCVDPTRGDGDAANFTLTSFKLKNIVTKGTLTYSGTSTVEADATVSGWTYGADDKVGDVFSRPASGELSWPWEVPGVNVTDRYAAVSDWFYFVPLDLADDAEIEFSFTMADTGQTIDVTRKLKEVTPAWVAGRMYAYFLVFQPVGIEFSVKWNDWDWDHPVETPLVNP